MTTTSVNANFEGEYLTPRNALEEAVLNTLISHGGENFSQKTCGIRTDGRPPNTAGQKFFGIWASVARNEYQVQVKINYTLHVTITLRSAEAPDDRRGRTVRRVFEEYSEPIKNLIAGGANPNAINVSNIANAFTHPTEPDFVAPLSFVDEMDPKPRAGDWWGAQPDKMAGMVQTINFSTWTLGGYC